MIFKRRALLRGRAYWPHIRALFFALLDRRTPWKARLVALAVVFYAVWPLDLIPDFIPFGRTGSLGRLLSQAHVELFHPVDE